MVGNGEAVGLVPMWQTDQWHYRKWSHTCEVMQVGSLNFFYQQEYAVEGMVDTEKLRGMAYLTALQGTTYNFATLPETVAFCDYVRTAHSKYSLLEIPREFYAGS